MIARGEDRNWQTMTVNRSEWVNNDPTGAWETPVAIRIPLTCVCRMHDAGVHGSSMYRMFHSLLLTWTCWIILEGLRGKSCLREKFYKNKTVSVIFFIYDRLKEKLIRLSNVKMRTLNKYVEEILYFFIEPFLCWYIYLWKRFRKK